MDTARKIVEQPNGHPIANQGIAVIAVVILTISAETVPFSQAREVTFPAPLARTLQGTIGFACSKHRHIAATGMSTLSLQGRPLAVLSAEGKSILSFTDTGSQITLIKRAVLNQLDPDGKLRHRPSDKVLRGVSGTHMHPAAEVTLRYDLGQRAIEHPTLIADLDFPGDILMGIDLLRSLNFTMRAKAGSSHGELVLGDHTYPVVFTEARSLKISLLTTTWSVAAQTEDQLEALAVKTEDPGLQQPLKATEYEGEDSEPEMEWDDFIEDTLEADVECSFLPCSRPHLKNLKLFNSSAELSYSSEGFNSDVDDSDDCREPEIHECIRGLEPGRDDADLGAPLSLEPCHRTLDEINSEEEML